MRVNYDYFGLPSKNSRSIPCPEFSFIAADLPLLRKMLLSTCVCGGVGAAGGSGGDRKNPQEKLFLHPLGMGWDSQKGPSEIQITGGR